jgi:regulator of RNase E activity RraA
MHEYRIYILDENGRIAGPATTLECVDDRAAVAQAQQQLNGRALEVWNGARKVVRLDPVHPRRL